MELSTTLSKKELPKYNLYYKEIDCLIVNYLMRNVNLVEDTKHNRLIHDLPSSSFKSISGHLDQPLTVVQCVSEQFLKQVLDFIKFLKICQIKWTHTPSKLFVKTRIYLHKLHKIVPVFDYNRAKVNLKNLHKFFEKEGFWPKISTQLAIIVYITDLLDTSGIFESRLMQKNIRVVCNCSAYVFHRTRNKMKIRRIMI